MWIVSWYSLVSRWHWTWTQLGESCYYSGSAAKARIKLLSIKCVPYSFHGLHFLFSLQSTVIHNQIVICTSIIWVAKLGSSGEKAGLELCRGETWSRYTNTLPCWDLYVTVETNCRARRNFQSPGFWLVAGQWVSWKNRHWNRWINGLTQYNEEAFARSVSMRFLWCTDLFYLGVHL